MNLKKHRFNLLLIILVVSVFLVPLTFSKYLSTYNREVTLNISKPSYQVVFHSNTTLDETSIQNFVYGTSQNLNANTFTNGSLSFISWNTEPDGTGTSYQNNQSVNNLTTVNNAQIDLYAQWSGNVAEINGVYYASIHAAINAVPTDGTLTTVNLLVDISLDVNSRIPIPSGKNIVLNLGTHNISNEQGANIPLIENEGTLRITNGSISTSAEQGAINNNSTGSLYLDNITISTTINKTRQAVYNDGGYLEINDGSNLSSMSSNRATVQNQAGGTIKILGGTIISQNYYGVQNSGNLTIGEKDGTADKTAPIIQGALYGVFANTSFNFYDGTIKGKTNAVNNVSKIADIETNHDLVHSAEVINSQNYDTLFLSNDIVTITFDPNGGTVSEPSRRVEKGLAIGSLPTPTYTGKIFDGWYTDPITGIKITSNEIVTGATTYYAHWTDGAAEIDGVYYTSFQEALSSIKNNNLTTIKIHSDFSGNYTIANGRNIIVDLQNHIITNGDNTPVFTNNGHLKLIGGTVTSGATQGAINNNSGKTLEIEDLTVAATGTRQALYNNGGTVTISGNSLLSAVSTERAALHNLANGNVTILGGTIKSTGQNAIENLATLTIGVKDGTIDTSAPFIIGISNGIKNTGTLKFYDGNINGVSSAIIGNFSEIETGSQVIDTTATFDGVTYYQKYLSL